MEVTGAIGAAMDPVVMEATEGMLTVVMVILAMEAITLNRIISHPIRSQFTHSLPTQPQSTMVGKSSSSARQICRVMCSTP